MTRVRDSTDPLQLVLALDVPASYFGRWWDADR
jgi:hypothetical protein